MARVTPRAARAARLAKWRATLATLQSARCSPVLVAAARRKVRHLQSYTRLHYT